MYQFFLEKICRRKVFHLTNNNHFIYCRNYPTIRVIDLPNNNDYLAYESLFRGTHHVVEVGPGAEYNVLEVFGALISGSTLHELATDLVLTGYFTNREGYCIVLNISKNSLRRSQGLRKYSRLNDLFIWAKYGVVPTSTSTTVWNRRDQHNNAILVNNEQLLDKLSRCEHSLQEEEDALKECYSELTELGKDLKDKYTRLGQEEKEIEDVREELEGMKKEVSVCQNSLTKEENVLEETNKELEECKRELEAKKKEILTSKKSLDYKEKLLVSMNKEIEDFKLRELEVKKNIGSNCEEQVGFTAELEEELCACKRVLEEKDKELTKLGGELLGKQGAIEALMEILNNFKKL